MSHFQIGQGWVSHHRPQKKLLAFKYPIFQILFPVSDGIPSPMKLFGLRFLTFDERRYLDGSQGPIKNRIEEFLRNECQYQPEEVWLQTLPQIFGYVFNPISFWFCLKNGELDAVLCEVNNTFGDRHFYFVPCQNGSPTKLVTKKFHVSPFFDVTGKYQFEFHVLESKTDIRILYFDDSGAELLNTRLFLTFQKESQVSPLHLFMKYGWLTIMVIVRIHFLALRMWLKKARFYRRPKPPQRKVST